jgi:outer membrane protein assembly factor BamB
MSQLILKPRIGFARIACVAALVAAYERCAPAYAQWPQWGGPNRDFKVDAGKLADKWPDDGPRKIWCRDLGEGYSAILVDGDTLYTMYRKVDPDAESARVGPPKPEDQPRPDGGKEAVIALDAATGKTKWEHAYPAEPFKETNLEFGKGPNGTPLIHDGNLYTVGFTGVLTCLNTKNGKVFWSHDLVEDFDGKKHEFGYSCSPILYKKFVIVPVGGNQTGLVAFDAATGDVAWRSEPLDVSYASPILIGVDGEDQVVFMSSTEVIGLSADGGKVRWRYRHANQYMNNCFMPIWDAAHNLLFVTSHTDAGTRVLRLSRDGDDCKAEEVWYDKKNKMFHSTGVLVGEYIYGSLGDQPPTFLAAVRVNDGKAMWKERGFPKANVLYADGKLIVLDEDGQLALARVSPEKCEVISKVQLLDKVAWTVPTLARGKLYIRDKKKILALDLGKSAS